MPTTRYGTAKGISTTEADYCRLLAPYGSQDEIAAKLFQTENSNMPLLGYGSKAFTISLVENAIKLTKGNISGDELLKIIDLGKTLLNMPGTPLEGVEETLKELHKKGTYKMVVFTKGDNLDQENKFKRSGLAKYFDDCIGSRQDATRIYAPLPPLRYEHWPAMHGWQLVQE